MEIRLGFVRKVYSILACQLGLTMILSTIYKSVPSVQSWAQQNPWILFASFLAAMISLGCLIWKRKSHPANYSLLALFTLFESHAIGTAVTFYDSVTVLQAVVITFALFVGLSLFACQTKYDFSGWQPFLFGSLWVCLLKT